MDVKALTVFLCLLVGGLAAPLRAQVAGQPLAAVRASAEKAVRGSLDAGASGVTLEAAALDPRLMLAPCAGKLETFVPELRANQSKVLVRVICPAPAWYLNVPVEIRSAHDVLVLKRAVGRGQVVEAADVDIQKRELPGLASPFVASVADLKDRLTRRPIPAGTALPADALTAALLIHRGQSVTLAAVSNGIEVRAPGLALADAPAHGRVRVQNLNSLKIVEGVADTDSVVRITF
jgi:flagellar basal body P-ring formation protein FlgA